MAKFLRVPLEGGGCLSFQVGESGGPSQTSGPVNAGADRVARQVTDAFLDAQPLKESLEPVRRMSEQLLVQMQETKATRLQVEFGLEVTFEAGAVITKAGGGCHFTITMTWEAQREVVASVTKQ